MRPEKQANGVCGIETRRYADAAAKTELQGRRGSRDGLPYAESVSAGYGGSPRNASVQLTLRTIARIWAGVMPVAYMPATRPPMLVPAMQSIGNVMLFQPFDHADVREAPHPRRRLAQVRCVGARGRGRMRSRGSPPRCITYAKAPPRGAWFGGDGSRSVVSVVFMLAPILGALPRHLGGAFYNAHGRLVVISHFSQACLDIVVRPGLPEPYAIPL